jgi:hypothetical protein
MSPFKIGQSRAQDEVSFTSSEEQREAMRLEGRNASKEVSPTRTSIGLGSHSKIVPNHFKTFVDADHASRGRFPHSRAFRRLRAKLRDRSGVSCGLSATGVAKQTRSLISFADERLLKASLAMDAERLGLKKVFKKGGSKHDLRTDHIKIPPAGSKTDNRRISLGT